VARARSLTQLRDRVRELADQQNSTFIADAQLDVMINQGIAKAWKEINRIAPARFRKTASQVTVANTLVYSLAADFMTIIGVDYIISAGPPKRFHSLLPYNFAERETYQFSGTQFPWYSDLRYEVIQGGIDGANDSLKFSADPGANTYDVHYSQAPQILVAGGDTFDGIAGYEDLACYEAVVAILNKEESDPGPALVQLQAEYQDIRSNLADARDDGVPRQIANMKRRGVHWPLS
jgi:hypothetical protein